MTRLKYAGMLALMLFLFVLPVQAFTANSMDIKVQGNGDAQIQFDYTLNWIENMAVYLRIANPANELRNAFNGNLQIPVTVEQVSSDSIRVSVPNFASKSVNKDGSTTMRTPALSFQQAEKVLQQYWFAPLINPDFSPAVTTITYPDGYSEKFYNTSSIPKTFHTTS